MRTPIRTLAVIAAAACTTMLVACTGPGTGAGTEPAAGAGPEGDGDVTLTYYSWNNQASFQPIVDAFEEKYPDITIDMSSANGNSAEYAQTLLTRASGNQLPDVFHLSLESQSELIDGERVRDITDEEFFQGANLAGTEIFQRDGRVFGMSTGAWAGVIIYNKQLLSQVGYDEVPTDIDGFIELGKALSGSGVTPYLEEVSSASPSLQPMLGGYYAASGKSDVDIFDGEASFSSWVPVLNQWKRLIDEGVLSKDVVGVSGDQVKQSFLSGEVAMYRSGTWDFIDIETAGIDFGTAPFPAVDGGEPFIGGGAESPFALSAALEGEKLKAAQTFLAFINSAEGLQLAEEHLSSVSTSANYDANVAPQIADVYEEYIQGGKYYWTVWPTNGAVMGQEFAAQMQLFILGEVTAEELTAALDAKWSAQ